MEVGGEAVHVLVVGQHGVSLRLEEVDVPDAQNGQQDGDVLIQRGAAEMVVLQRREEVKSRRSTSQPLYNCCSIYAPSLQFLQVHNSV